MNNIAQVVQRLSPGGIEVLALEILRLQNEQTQMWIVSLEGKKTELLERWPRLRLFADRLIALDKPEGWCLHTLKELKNWFEKNNIQAVHTHHIGPLLYGGAAARLAGIKTLVHTEHDAWHLQSAKRRFLETTAVRWFRPTIVADSQMVAKAMKRDLHISDVLVIPNGVDTHHFCPGDKSDARKILGLPEGVKIVGCAGRLEMVKGQIILLEALRSLPEDVHVVLAGDGSQKSHLQAYSKNNELQNRVHFLGHVDDMLTFYQSLDVFCLPSLYEGMPLAPLEAQACGVPAVLTDTGGCAETLCPQTGTLIKPNAPQEMAAALHKALISKAPNSPREFVCRHADAAIMADAYRALCSNQS